MGYSGGSETKASDRNVGDLGLIPGSGRSTGEGNGNPLHYSWLENPMDRGAWWATVHGVAKSRARLSNFTFTFIVTLQCCVRIYSSAKWISCRDTCVASLLDFAPSPPHPIHLGHHQAELPVIHSRFSLATCFTHGRAQTSIPLPQFTPSNCCVHTSIFIRHSFSLFTFILLTTISATHNGFRQHSALEVEWWTRQTRSLISKGGTHVGRDNKIGRQKTE